MMQNSIRFSSSGVSAACAVITLVGGGCGAAISWFKADEAASSAELVTKQLEESRRQTELSARNLSEIKGLRLATEDQASSAARFASAAEKSAAFAPNQAASLAGSRAASEQLANTAHRQLAANEESSKEIMSGRIVFHGMSITSLGVNQNSSARVVFEKSGHLEPANIMMWSSMTFRMKDQNLMRAPSCGVGNSWQAMGPFALGSYVSTAKQPMTQTDFDQHMARGDGFFVYGAICYKDTFGRSHRTDFCAIVRSKDDFVGCPGTDDPT